MKKLLRTVLAAVMAFTACFSLAGCKSAAGTDDLNEKVDDTKTQLKIAVYNGGLGAQWVRAVADGFEEKYKDYKIGDKTGVQVMIYPEKDRYLDDTLIANLTAKIETSDVYYTVSGGPRRFRNANLLSDITDILNEKIYGDDGEIASDGEGVKSILDKMDPYYGDIFSYDGKYYGFPYEESLQGIVYDVDLFDEYNWSVPETMEDFYNLLEEMKTVGVTPFTWTGYYSFYLTSLTAAVVAQYEGMDGAIQNILYNGRFEGTPITNENAYLLAGQQGKLEALKFLQKIASDTKNYSKDVWKGSQTHLMAQSEFLTSKYASQRIAMIVEGDWWENEARAVFGEMGSSEADDAYGKRNFAFMPIPEISGQKTPSDEHVYYTLNSGTLAFVNNASELKELAGLWVQWTLQDSQLAIFNKTTGCTLPYEYSMSEDRLAELTPFARNVYSIKHDPKSKIIRHANACDFYDYGSLKVGGVTTEIYSTVTHNGRPATYDEALRAFCNNSWLTAEEYFEGSKEYYKSNWQTALDAFNKLQVG